MSKLELLKFLETFEGEVEISDFTPSELEELIARTSDTEKPLTVEEFKRRYFEFHDDVKDKSLKKQDW